MLAHRHTARLGLEQACQAEREREQHFRASSQAPPAAAWSPRPCVSMHGKGALLSLAFLSSQQCSEQGFDATLFSLWDSGVALTCLTSILPNVHRAPIAQVVQSRTTSGQ